MPLPSAQRVQISDGTVANDAIIGREKWNVTSVPYPPIPFTYSRLNQAPRRFGPRSAGGRHKPRQKRLHHRRAAASHHRFIKFAVGPLTDIVHRTAHQSHVGRMFCASGSDSTPPADGGAWHFINLYPPDPRRSILARGRPWIRTYVYSNMLTPG